MVNQERTWNVSKRRKELTKKQKTAEAVGMNIGMIRHWQAVIQRYDERVAECDAEIAAINERKAKLGLERAKAPEALAAAVEARGRLQQQIKLNEVDPKIQKLAKLLATVRELEAGIAADQAMMAKGGGT